MSNLQDLFLAELQRQGITVSIFLVNGIKLHGTVGSFDDSIIMLKNTITQMVYKHSVSTVVPSQLVEIPASDKN